MLAGKEIRAEFWERRQPRACHASPRPAGGPHRRAKRENRHAGPTRLEEARRGRSPTDMARYRRPGSLAFPMEVCLPRHLQCPKFRAAYRWANHPPVVALDLQTNEAIVESYAFPDDCLRSGGDPSGDPRAGVDGERGASLGGGAVGERRHDTGGG